MKFNIYPLCSLPILVMATLLMFGVALTQAETFLAPEGIYALGPAKDNAATSFDDRLSGIRDYDFVTGYTLRVLWEDVETSEGVYDFSVIDSAIQSTQAIGQRLNLELLDAPPDYVITGAADTYIDHKGGDRPVPWDPFQRSRHLALREALANFVIDDGLGLALSDHPTLAAIDSSPAGLNFGVRDLNNGLRSHPDYTAERYIDAVVDGTVLTQATFPKHQGYIAFFGFDDGIVDPPVEEQLITELSNLFNGEGQPALSFFVENLSDIGPTSSSSIGANLESWVELGGSTMIQALDSWQRHPTARDAQLASLNPAVGIELAFNAFGTKFFELYLADLDAAAEGAVDANGNSLLDDLRKWNTLLTENGLEGDYNNDGVVDAADYTYWRDNLGATEGSLPNDPHGGFIGQMQYETWVANYGMTLAENSTTSTVPEPSALFLHLLSLAAKMPKRVDS